MVRELLSPSGAKESNSGKGEGGLLRNDYAQRKDSFVEDKSFFYDN